MNHTEYMKVLKRFKITKTKKLFLFFGVLNFIITNIALQVLLLLIPIYLATILSQIINVLIGYFLWQKLFKLKVLNNYIFKKYLLLAFILWVLNFGFIQLFFQYGFNKNLTAILIIPLLVSFSYLSQKYYVFKK